MDLTVRLWDPATGTLRSMLEDHTEEITAVLFSGDSHLLAPAARDEKPRLWDPATGNLVQRFEAEGAVELSFSAGSNATRDQRSSDPAFQ